MPIFQYDEDFNSEDDFRCRLCGSLECDGLKNCDKCGEDTDCQSRLCINCQQQEDIDNDPNSGDPRYIPQGWL